MIIRNLTRRLGLMFLSLGLLTTAQAADLQTNLVVNPSFEEVDDGDLGPFESVRFFDWEDVDGDEDDNFAYFYSFGYSGTPQPPDSGDFHFTGGFTTVAGEPLLTQTIALDSGATADAIAGGDAPFYLSAFFSTFQDQLEASSVRVQFLDGGNVLGEAAIGGVDFLGGLPVISGQRYWGQDVANGIIPAATTDVQIDILPNGDATNYDGYLDLVDFRVGGLPTDEALVLEVNQSGVASIVNETGDPIELNYYEINSSAGALNANTWNSLQDQDLEQNGAPGTGNGWEEAGGSGPNVLSEAFWLGDSTLDTGSQWNLGTIGVPSAGDNLTFRYGLPNGLLLHGIVQAPDGGTMVGDTNGDGAVDAHDIDFLYAALRSPEPDASLDLNSDGVVDTADVDRLVIDILGSNYGDSDGSGIFNSSDFVAVFGIGEYEDAIDGNSTWTDGDWNGDADFDSSDLVFVFQKGSFVAASTASVPEPTTATIALAGLLVGASQFRSRRRTKRC